MAVQSFYGNTSRDVGTPAMVSFLTNWFDERRQMNEEAMKGEAPPDLDKMRDAELAAREELGRLQRALVEARSGVIKSSNDLAKTVVQERSAITQRNIDAAAKIGAQKLWMQVQFLDKSTKEAEQLNKDSAIDPDTRQKIRTIAQRVASGQTPAASADAEVKALIRDSGGKAPGETKYDAFAAAYWQELVEAKTPADTLTNATKLAQPNLEAGQTPADYWYARHHASEQKEMLDMAEERYRKIGAGADPDSVFESVRMMGIDPTDLGLTEETTTRTGGTVPRGEAEGPTRGGGGSVSVKGGGPGAAQFAAAVAKGEDPFAALEAGIKAQADYANLLAGQRKEAELASLERRSRFPRANPYTANPNTYVNARGQAAARAVAENDPGVNREQADALLRNRGNINRAYAETGEIEPEFAPREYLDLDLTDVGDFSALKGDELAKVVVTQPAEVQALFRPALILLKSGDTKAAEAEARRVTADDVRGAYGMAFQRASRDPAEAGRLQQSIEALPDEVGGAFKKAAQDAMGHYAKVAQRGGKMADRQLLASWDNLGTALLTAGESAERRDFKAKAEEREPLTPTPKPPPRVEPPPVKATAAEEFAATLSPDKAATKEQQARLPSSLSGGPRMRGAPEPDAPIEAEPKGSIQVEGGAPTMAAPTEDDEFAVFASEWKPEGKKKTEPEDDDFAAFAKEWKP